jgi:hypothetical protein
VTRLRRAASRDKQGDDHGLLHHQPEAVEAARIEPRLEVHKGEDREHHCEQGGREEPPQALAPREWLRSGAGGKVGHGIPRFLGARRLPRIIDRRARRIEATDGPTGWTRTATEYFAKVQYLIRK